MTYRPYKLPWKDNEKDPRFIAFQDRLKGQITALVDSGITDFYTGMAEGTDLWAGKAVLQLRRSNPAIRLHCIIPYADQPGPRTFWIPEGAGAFSFHFR